MFSKIVTFKKIRFRMEMNNAHDIVLGTYDRGFIPGLDMSYKEDEDNVMLSNGRQNYEMKRSDFLEMVKFLYENTFAGDNEIYITDVYTDGKTKPFFDIIEENPHAIWSTRYRGITTKTIELLSSNHKGLKENQFQLLSVNGVYKDKWELSMLIQSYKVGNDGVVKQMKKRFDLSNESTKGFIRNTRNLMDSWTNMWDQDHHGKEQTNAVKEPAITVKDQSTQTSPHMKNNNTFKDDDVYPMHLTRSDDEAMQWRTDHKFTIKDLIIHKLANKSAEYCNGCQDVVGAIYNIEWMTNTHYDGVIHHLKYLSRNFSDVPHRSDCLVENRLKFTLHHFTMVCQDIAVSTIPYDEWTEAILYMREYTFNHSLDPTTARFLDEKKVEMYYKSQTHCKELLDSILSKLCS